MKKDDQNRIDTFMSAYRRGDMFTQARLLHEELGLLAVAWCRNPIRHLIVGLALALAFQVLREVTGGPLLLDVIGLMALVWYGVFRPDTWETGVRRHGKHLCLGHTVQEKPMPWQPRDLMSTKREFVQLAMQEGTNRRELCRRFGISPKAGYALLKRFSVEGEKAFTERSRRPLHSPRQTVQALQSAVLELRRQHPAWGARKICRRLQDLGHTQVPAASTVSDLLRRHGLIEPADNDIRCEWQRFEHELPNGLWQMDFKGYFETAQGRCTPLTVLDDHSRFSLATLACSKTDGATVQALPQGIFERYGLPARINSDNGSPWGSPSAPGNLSSLDVWMIRLGVRSTHSAPYHPQTNGKIERFHRSLKGEVLRGKTFDSLAHAQEAMQRWREIYNQHRPHEALAMQTPAQHYSMSPRPMPTTLAPIEYAERDHVLTVGWNGFVKFEGHKLRLSNALHRLPVAFRPDDLHDGCFDLYFCHQRFMRLDMNDLTASN